MLEADYSMATGIQLGTTCSDRDHERLMPQFASMHAMTPGPCTACVIAALFVLATIRAAAPQETQAFINQGLIHMVGMVDRGHWPPKPVPVLSTLLLVAVAKQRVKKSSNFDSFAAPEGSLAEQPEGCLAQTLAAGLDSGLSMCCTSPASAELGSVPLCVKQYPQREPDTSLRNISVQAAEKRKIHQCTKGQ